MKKTTLACAVATAILSSTAVQAGEFKIYGKANLSFQSADEKGKSTTEVESNASRLGIKGSEKISEELTAIYQFEYEVHLDDGDKKGKTFTQRTSYVGLKGSAGEIIAGKLDTPLKKAQKKVDLFGDLEGDIKSVLTKNDNRTDNTVQYSSVKSSGVQFKLAHISSEVDGVDPGISTSISWDDLKNSGVYLALAHDADVEKETSSVTRAVAQFKLDDITLGMLYEQQDKGKSSLLDGDAFMTSIAYKANNQLVLKAQYGESDTVYKGTETWSLGFDYKLAKKVKVFTYYTHEEADSLAKDNEYAGVGIEVKF